MNTTKSYKVVPTHYSIPNKIVRIIDNNSEVGEMVKIEYYRHPDFETDIINKKDLIEIQ